MRRIETDKLTRMLLVGGVMLRSSVLGFSLELPTKTLVDLSSSEFHKREAAQSELLVWSRRQHEPAMEELFSQSQAAVDPEVRQRCLNVLRELVMVPRGWPHCELDDHIGGDDLRRVDVSGDFGMLCEHRREEHP